MKLGIQERRYTRKEECRTGGMQDLARLEGCRNRRMQGMRDARKEGCRKGVVQENRDAGKDAGKEGCRKRGIQEKRDSGKEGF